MKLAPLFLLLWQDAIAEQGAPECPCISSSSGIYGQLRESLRASSRPEDYGTTGCQAYDAGQALFGCEENRSSHCSSEWCYVDMTLCPVDEELCRAAGGPLGSSASPHCRSRPRDVTKLLNMSVYYSYETCGFINLYDFTRHSASVGGHQLRAVVDVFPPWVVQRNSSRGDLGYGGATYDFFQEVLHLFDPPAMLQVMPGWATEKSRQLFSSSYTACVHDVAVGNFDVCIADLWLTPNRNRLATFLPPFRQDLFYLVVPKKIEEVTFLSYLERPFLPFTVDAWLGVLAFLCGLSVVLWLVNFVDTPRSEREGCKWSLQELCRFIWFVWHDFLLGQSSQETEPGPARKFFSLAFSFFILVTISSYTASLASMLVVQREASGAITSIEDAIAQGVSICAPSVLAETFSAVFPAKFVDCEAISHCPRLLHAGRCAAMIVSEDVINSMHAGNIHQQDCDAVNSGSITEELGRCMNNHRDEPRNDCELIRVGDLLWSVPLSFPISDRLSHSISWAVTRALTDGLFEQVKESKTNREAFPVSQCAVVEDRSEEDGLNLSDLTGTIFISVFMVVFGLICFVIEVLRREEGCRGWLGTAVEPKQIPADLESPEESQPLAGPEPDLAGPEPEESPSAPEEAAEAPHPLEKVEEQPQQEKDEKEEADPAPDPSPIPEPRGHQPQASPLAQAEFPQHI